MLEEFVLLKNQNQFHLFYFMLSYKHIQMGRTSWFGKWSNFQCTNKCILTNG